MSAIGHFFHKIGDTIKHDFQTVGNDIKKVGQGVVHTAEHAGHAIKDVAQGVGHIAEDAVHVGKDVVTGHVGDVGGDLKHLGHDSIGTIKTAGKGVVTYAKDNISTLGKGLTVAKDGVTDGFKYSPAGAFFDHTKPGQALLKASSKVGNVLYKGVSTVIKYSPTGLAVKAGEAGKFGGLGKTIAGGADGLFKSAIANPAKAALTETNFEKKALGAVNLGTNFIPGVGEIGAAAKGAEALADVSKVAEGTEAVASLGKGAEAAGVVGKAAKAAPTAIADNAISQAANKATSGYSSPSMRKSAAMPDPQSYDAGILARNDSAFEGDLAAADPLAAKTFARQPIGDMSQFSYGAPAAVESHVIDA